MKNLRSASIRNNMHEVFYGDVSIGYLEKLRDNRTTQHPWKAFNLEWKLIAVFYKSDNLLDPKQAAMEAVLYNADDVRPVLAI